jgi:hypothetical protein
MYVKILGRLPVLSWKGIIGLMFGAGTSVQDKTTASSDFTIY